MPADIAPAMPEKKVYPVIPEGVYQAVISDVESGKQKPYDQRFDTNAPQSEPYYLFKFKILTPGEAQGRLLWSKRGKACLPVPPEGKMKESLIYRVASAVKGSKISYDEGSLWTLKDVNNLAGKQIVLVVEVTNKQDGTEMNTITTFMHARENLPDMDEDNGGAETPPQQPQTTSPARYNTVPKKFQPAAVPGPDIDIDMTA